MSTMKTTASALEVLVRPARAAGRRDGFADIAEGALAVLKAAADTDGDVLSAASHDALALLEPCARIDFGFRVLHPVGIMLTQQAPCRLVSVALPGYLSLYAASGTAGGREDTDYGLCLQSYAIALVSRGLETAIDIVPLVNSGVDAALWTASGSGYSPALLEDFGGARATVKAKIQTCALKSLAALDEDSWKELLRRR